MQYLHLRNLLSKEKRGGKVTNNRIVATGMGAITPIGIGVASYWDNLIKGKSGVTAISRFDVNELPVKIAAEVKDFSFQATGVFIYGLSITILLSRLASGII
jgi:3-oxoacyl-(acyl-carrier-protein) synthase